MQEVGSASHSRFLQDLDSSGDAHFKHASPEQWDGEDGFFSRMRQPLSYSDLGSSQNTSALPLPSAAGFEDEADDVLHVDEEEHTMPACPPTPSRTPGYCRDGPLVRQNSLGESKLLIASQQSDAAASCGPDTRDQSHSLHDSFEGWSTIGQGSFSIAFQVSLVTFSFPKVCLRIHQACEAKRHICNGCLPYLVSFSQAKKKEDGKFYAIKRSKNALKSKGERASLLKEFKAAMAIGENSNIVKYHTAWQENGCLWMQMELCDRGSLKRILQKVAEKRQEVLKDPHSTKSRHRIEKWGSFAPDVLGGRLPESSCWRFAGSVARGLAHIHAQGYIYLDVKPDNTFITRGGEYKLGDLGMAAAYKGGAPAAAPAQPILRCDDSSSDADTPRFGRPAGMASRKLSFAQAGGMAAAGGGTGLFGADDSFEVLRVASDDANGGDLSDDEEGDVQYMAAELLKPGNHKPAADMFSLGISLFEVVWGHEALPKSGHEWHALRSGNMPACPDAARRSPQLLELVRALMHPEPSQRPTAAQVAALPQVQHALSATEDEFLRVFDPVGEPSCGGGASFAQSQKTRSGSVHNLLANGGMAEMQAAVDAADGRGAAAPTARHTGASMASTTTPFKVTWDDEERLDAGGAPQRPSARARGYLRTRSGNLMSQTPQPVPCALRGQELGLQAAPSVQRSVTAFSAVPPPTPASSQHSKQVAWAPKAPARISACDTSDEDIGAVARPADFALGVGTPAAAPRCRDGAPPSTGRAGRMWGGDDALAGAARRRLSRIDEECFSDAGSCGSNAFSPPRRGILHGCGDTEEDDGEAPSPIAMSGHGSPVDMMGAAATPFTRAGTAAGRTKTKARTSGCLTPQQLDESTDSDRMVQSAAKRMAMMTLSPEKEAEYSAAHGGAAPPRAAVPMHGQRQDDLSSGSGACAVPAPMRGKRPSQDMLVSEPMTACVVASLFQQGEDDEDDAQLSPASAGGRSSPAVVPMRRFNRGGLQCDVGSQQPGTHVDTMAVGAWSSGGTGSMSRASSAQSLDSINSNVKAQAAFAVSAPPSAESAIAPGFTVPALHVRTTSCGNGGGLLSPNLHTPGGYITPMAQGTDGEYHWANN